MNNLVKVSHHYWILLKLSIKLKSTWAAKWGDSLFKLGRYNRVFLEIWAQIPIWAPMLKQWAVGFFSCENTTEELTGTHKCSFFFIKTSKWKKWWSWWLRMTNAFILCNLLWKVQKSLAANREGSFNNKLNSWLNKDFRSSGMTHQPKYQFGELCLIHQLVFYEILPVCPPWDNYCCGIVTDACLLWDNHLLRDCDSYDSTLGQPLIVGLWQLPVYSGTTPYCGIVTAACLLWDNPLLWDCDSCLSTLGQPLIVGLWQMPVYSGTTTYCGIVTTTCLLWDNPLLWDCDSCLSTLGQPLIEGLWQLPVYSGTTPYWGIVTAACLLWDNPLLWDCQKCLSTLGQPLIVGL